jgi:hypothetical protein
LPNTSMARWARAAGTVTFVAGGVLFGIAGPAAANTNFNGVCESSEACIWDLDYYEGQWMWDYEGTDTNFTNNYYPQSGGPRLNDTATAIENRGTSCTAVFGQNIGGASAQGWTIRVARNTVWDGFYDYRNNGASSLWWSC